MAKKTKDFNYFEYFSEVVSIAVEGAKALENAVRTFDYTTFPERMKEIHEIEHRADHAKHTMIEVLAHEFITPIERDDIVELAQELDNVVDCIDDVARCIYKYNIQTIREETLEYISLIVKACQSLKLVTDEFENFKNSRKIKEYIVQVNQYESDGDDLLSASLRKLYSDGSSDRDVIVWTNMFEDLENCLDAAEDCVDIIESVIMNNT